MTTSNLETKLLAVTQAVAEFETACDQEYSNHCKRLSREGLKSSKVYAQIALQDQVRDMVSLGTYSAAQCRAVQGAFSAWHPPIPKAVGSLALIGRGVR